MFINNSMRDYSLNFILFEAIAKESLKSFSLLVFHFNLLFLPEKQQNKENKEKMESLVNETIWAACLQRAFLF